MAKNEKIHIEDSHKYQKFEIDMIAETSGFSVETQYFDVERKYTLNVFVPSKQTVDPSRILSNLKEGWNLADLLFGSVLKADTMMQKPIELRHPFIFYVGHLTAFEKNQIFKMILNITSETEHFDDLFERGIDPMVDDPAICHKHSADINHSVWPSLEELRNYQDNTRRMIENSFSQVALKKNDLMAQKARVFKMVNEHTLMHIETLLYMIQVTEGKFKQPLPKDKLNYDFQKVTFIQRLNINKH